MKSTTAENDGKGLAAKREELIKCGCALRTEAIQGMMKRVVSTLFTRSKKVEPDPATDQVDRGIHA